MKHFLQSAATALLALAAPLATQAADAEPFDESVDPTARKIAFVICSEPSSGEKAALSFFSSKFGLSETETAAGTGGSERNADILQTNDLGDKLIRDNFDCVWVHIDRDNSELTGVGYRYFPQEFRTQAFFNAIYKFLADGGNVYLSGQANQLLYPIWRVNQNYNPNKVEFGACDNGDAWAAGVRDCREHPVYFGLDWDGDVINFISGQNHRTNRNCHWQFFNTPNELAKAMTYVTEDGSNIERFEKDTYSKVIGTFNWDNQGEYGEIVEFYPLYSFDFKNNTGNNPENWTFRKGGTVICNGMGTTCAWETQNNGSRDNLEKFNYNVLRYLSPVDGEAGPADPNADYVSGIPEHMPASLPGSDGLAEVLESTGRIALYLDFEDDDELEKTTDDGQAYLYPQEVAAYQYFQENIMTRHQGAAVLWKGDLDKIRFVASEEDLGAVNLGSSFECIWVHCDRQGIFDGVEGTPDASHLLQKYGSSELVEKLKAFSAAGGNIYLSKWATLLITELGHCDYSPNYIQTEGKEGVADKWGMTVNVKNADNYDKTGHPIFENLKLDKEEHGECIYLFSGNEHREDANCVWKLQEAEQSYGNNAAERLREFNNRHNATVLGVWGHNADEAFNTPVLVEFHPQASTSKNAPMRTASKSDVLARRGSVVTNGQGAYMWSTKDVEGTNESDQNVSALTTNVLSYLSPKMSEVMEPFPTAVRDLDEERLETSSRYFNLQGVEIPFPSGIYIEVKGNKGTKKTTL